MSSAFEVTPDGAPSFKPISALDATGVLAKAQYLMGCKWAALRSALSLLENPATSDLSDESHRMTQLSSLAFNASWANDELLELRSRWMDLGHQARDFDEMLSSNSFTWRGGD